MIVNLDKIHRIRSDVYSWRLESEHIHDGKVKWKALGHYTSFESALLNAYRREIRTDPAEGLKDCITAAETALTKYKTILDEFRDVSRQR